jgi:hypothetical protein
MSQQFMVLDIGYGNKAPIILGRPFLHTANATIFTGTAKINLHLDVTLRFPFQPHPKPPKCRPWRKNKQAEGHSVLFIIEDARAGLTEHYQHFFLEKAS